MVVRADPENNEIYALFNLADIRGRDVLEIGCGDGRLTRRYADSVAHVMAVDPWAEGIVRARKNLPVELQGHVEFHHDSFLDFASGTESSSFNVAILSWSL